MRRHAAITCGICSSPSWPGCETQTFSAAAVQGMRAGAASEHHLCAEMEERACRELGESRSPVCKFNEGALTSDAAELSKPISHAWVQQGPRESGGGLIGISLQRE